MLQADVKVSKGLGPKGYGKVRISAITREPETPSANFNFTYSAQFRYRWRQYYLHSSLIDLAEPGKHSFRLGDEEVIMNLPEPRAGTRSVLLADPCFASGAVSCAYGSKWDILNKTTTLLNRAFDVREGKPDMLAIIGDNFYDRTGDLSPEFFSKLSANVRSSYLNVVVGNHDIWGCGHPLCGIASDQQGYGQMQYFPMDTIASTVAVGGNDGMDFLAFNVDPDVSNLQYASLVTAEFLLFACIFGLFFCSVCKCVSSIRMAWSKTSQPISEYEELHPGRVELVASASNVGNAKDASVTPSATEHQSVAGVQGRICKVGASLLFGLLLVLVVAGFEFSQPWHRFTNDSNNFLWYHRLGNMGFVGFSGAATWQETRPHLEAACDFFGSEKGLEAIVLMGHWNADGMGCSADMATPVVRSAMSGMRGCDRFGEKLKFFNGHEHCNLIQEFDAAGEARGFQIGGHGMSTSKRCSKVKGHGEYGFAFLDSTSGRLRVHYFDLAPTLEGDPFQKLHDCVIRDGLHGCIHLADQWLDIGLA